MSGAALLWRVKADLRLPVLANDAQLRTHLLRADGQEDICLATYAISTGVSRTTYLLREVILPQDEEREVHGNASFTGEYVLRAGALAAADGLGVAVLHSHPAGAGWQQLSGLDADAESSYAHLVSTLTGHPLVGLTLAGDASWSARTWQDPQHPRHAETVRVVDARLRITWNDSLRPPPPEQPTQVRTISGWGSKIQADLARLRVLVIGVGSVGLDVALRLAATGIVHIGVMDFDTIKNVNLDRIPSATTLDAWLAQGKAEHALRQLRRAATAATPDLRAYEHSICEPAGHDIALDYDVIFCCVDRPWPRAVLNQLAYSDLIPVIDGGIAIDPFPDGQGMRDATWRSHVLRPGRPCMVCTKQLNPGDIEPDRQDLLDDPEYVRGAGRRAPARQNVALLSVSVAASQLAQFVSLATAPGGRGEPGPLQYVLSTHDLTPVPADANGCAFEQTLVSGNNRVPLTGPHARAEATRRRRRERRRKPRIWVVQALRSVVDSAVLRLVRADRAGDGARVRLVKDRES